MAVDMEKQKIVEQFRLHEKDTGSPEVQIALLTERINYLTEHFKAHKKESEEVPPRLSQTKRYRALSHTDRTIGDQEVGSRLLRGDRLYV